MAPKIVCIYVPLLDEGVSVIRSTSGEKLGNNIFRVLPIENYNSATEIWAFPPGTIVKCVKEVWEGNEILVVKGEYSEIL